MSTQKLFHLGILLGLICLRAIQAAECLPAPAGQLFWWRLEDNGQDTMKRLDLTVPSTATYETGKVGQGLTFDGLQGVTIGAVPELNRTSFTWEAWVRRADTNLASLASPADGAIIAGGAQSFSLTIGHAGNLFLSHVGVRSYDFGASITDLDWHHVCLLRNGDLFRLYLDGVSAGQLEVAGIVTESAYAVGSLSASFGGYFYALLGSVDEVAFFSRELESTEIKALYDAGATGRCVDVVNPPCTAVPDGLVAWYPLDVGPENLAPAGQPGTAGVESYGPGKVRGAATFDGLNPGIVLPEDPRMRTQEFTVEAWVRRASTTASSQASPADGAVFSGGTRSYAMAIRSDGVLYLSHVGEVSIPSDGRLLDTEWHHVAMAKSGSQMFFYLDGLPVGVRDLGGIVFDLSTPFAIGSLGVPFFGIHYAFLGSVDELGFYDRPLSGTEIFSIWSAGDRGKCRGDLGLNLDVPEEVVEGSGFAYAVNVVNQGTNRLDGVVVTNRVPAGFEVRETQPEVGAAQVTAADAGTEV
ncbi:MAG: LamG domain-containing protein, partial [Verrucomicrobia bacterium]|nr:LamG domain-containing protein [Verrucomicrobiota bacterium]